MFFNCFLNIVYLNIVFQGVQSGDLQWFGFYVQFGDCCVFVCYVFGEDVVVVVDIEDFFIEQVVGVFGNIVQLQWVDVVEWFEFVFQILLV